MNHSIYAVSKLEMNDSNHVEDRNGKPGESATSNENISGTAFKHPKHHVDDKECNSKRNYTLPTKDLKKENCKTQKACSRLKDIGNKISSNVDGKSIKPFLLKTTNSTKITEGLITPINWATLSSFSLLKEYSKPRLYANSVHMPPGSITTLSSCTSLNQSLKGKHSKGMPQSVTFCSSYRKPTITDPIHLYQYYKKNWKNCHIPGESCLPICLETRDSLRFLSN